jgi:hypothetical protein
MISYTKMHGATGRITIESIKPADINFMTLMFSLIPSVAKFSNPSMADWILCVVLLVIGLIFGSIVKASYHFNLPLRIMGYMHYELQTTHKVTFIMLSQKKLINSADIKKYVQLADHMLVNIS